MGNLKFAFDNSEKDLGLPGMLDPEDLLTNEKPDERQIMTYVSCYYHAFQGAMQVLQCRLGYCNTLLGPDIKRQDHGP